MDSSNVTLYCVRVMFKFIDKDVINFKIVTDTVDGIKQFIASLKSLANIDNIACEYLHEYSCAYLGILHEVYNKVGDK